MPCLSDIQHTLAGVLAEFISTEARWTKVAWVHIVYLRWLTSKTCTKVYRKFVACRFIWSATWRSLEGQIGYLPADRGKPMYFKMTYGRQSKLIHRLFLDSWQELSWLVLVEVYHLWIILKANLENWSRWIILLLVFCIVTNKIRKCTDTAVAFTQEYSRVAYPLGNVSTLSTGSGSSKDTHAGVEKTEERTFYI